jgi:hypothetical protein
MGEKCSEISGVGVIIASHPNQTVPDADPYLTRIQGRRVGSVVVQV